MIFQVKGDDAGWISSNADPSFFQRKILSVLGTGSGVTGDPPPRRWAPVKTNVGRAQAPCQETATPNITQTGSHGSLLYHAKTHCPTGGFDHSNPVQSNQTLWYFSRCVKATVSLLK